MTELRSGCRFDRNPLRNAFGNLSSPLLGSFSLPPTPKPSTLVRIVERPRLENGRLTGMCLRLRIAHRRGVELHNAQRAAERRNEVENREAVGGDRRGDKRGKRRKAREKERGWDGVS